MLGIIGAMDEEVLQLKTHMEQPAITKLAGMEFYHGTLSGKEAVVVRCGIGKVNAAVCTQLLIDRFGVDAIVNTGIAGSLKAEINIGDIVLSSDALQHDVDVTAFGHAPGKIPRMDTYAFPGDPDLIALAQEACKKVNPHLHTFLGRIVSGDQFISDKAVKTRIAETFGGYCTEMEGAAIAQAAYLNNVPFLIVRSISDKADDSASMDYDTFEAMAIENGVKLLLELAGRI